VLGKVEGASVGGAAGRSPGLAATAFTSAGGGPSACARAAGGKAAFIASWPSTVCRGKRPALLHHTTTRLGQCARRGRRQTGQITGGI
jgi:hypothetical protein